MDWWCSMFIKNFRRGEIYNYFSLLVLQSVIDYLQQSDPPSRRLYSVQLNIYLNVPLCSQSQYRSLVTHVSMSIYHVVSCLFDLLQGSGIQQMLTMIERTRTKKMWVKMKVREMANLFIEGSCLSSSESLSCELFSICDMKVCPCVSQVLQLFFLTGILNITH